jgi:hypothetical protein
MNNSVDFNDIAGNVTFQRKKNSTNESCLSVSSHWVVTGSGSGKRMVEGSCDLDNVPSYSIKWRILLKVLSDC